MNEYKMKCYEGNHPRIDVTDEFITKNNLTLSRTQKEILDYIKKHSGGFSFEDEVLIDYLDWENSKDLYKEEYVQKVDSGEEKFEGPITDIKEAVQDLLDYLVFGWMKALDERGISASRTIDKIKAWLWLLGREDLSIIVSSDELYLPYGMPALIKVSEELGIGVPQDCKDFVSKY